jgi:hypothetical protein
VVTRTRRDFTSKRIGQAATHPIKSSQSPHCIPKADFTHIAFVDIWARLDYARYCSDASLENAPTFRSAPSSSIHPYISSTPADPQLPSRLNPIVGEPTTAEHSCGIFQFPLKLAPFSLLASCTESESEPYEGCRIRRPRSPGLERDGD